MSIHYIVLEISNFDMINRINEYHHQLDGVGKNIFFSWVNVGFYIYIFFLLIYDMIFSKILNNQTHMS